MNSYSSAWHASSGTYSQISGGAQQCRCARHCRCKAGQPCQCGGGCTCKQSGPVPGAPRSDLWTDAGEGELRRSSAARSYPRPSSLSARQRWLRLRAQGPLHRRLLSQQHWQRRARLNDYFSRRFGWTQYMTQLSGVVGCPTCTPDSQRFAMALARWQRRNRMRPTGVLTPALWYGLQRYLVPMTASTGLDAAPSSTDAAPMDPMQPIDAPRSEPPVETGAPASDDSASSGAPAAEEFGIGFRARRLRPGTPQYYAALRPQGARSSRV